MLTMCWVLRRVVSHIHGSILEKHTVSIFRAEVTKLGSGWLICD
jgi:hypothetical protein